MHLLSKIAGSTFQFGRCSGHCTCLASGASVKATWFLCMVGESARDWNCLWTRGITHLSIYVSIYLSIYQSFDLSIYLSTYLSICLSIYRSIHPSIYACMHTYITLCIYITLYNKGPSGRILQVVAHVMILGNLWHAGVSKKIKNSSGCTDNVCHFSGPQNFQMILHVYIIMCFMCQKIHIIQYSVVQTIDVGVATSTSPFLNE